MAWSFHEAAKKLENPTEGKASPVLPHLPITFLYRHSIELYLKSLIVLLHRYFSIPFRPGGSCDDEPQIQTQGRWKRMYATHSVKELFDYLIILYILQKEYIEKKTNTEWRLLSDLGKFIDVIEKTDRNGTFFRYPDTSVGDESKKSDMKPIEVDELLELNKLSKGSISLIVDDGEGNILRCFRSDKSNPIQTELDCLKATIERLSCLHIALRMRFFDGR